MPTKTDRVSTSYRFAWDVLPAVGSGCTQISILRMEGENNIKRQTSMRFIVTPNEYLFSNKERCIKQLAKKEDQIR